MITKALIHEYGNGKIEPEHLAVKNSLEAKGIECSLFTTKRLQRNQLALHEETLVVGDHPTMALVFKRMGIHLEQDTYPDSLKKYLERNVWESSIRKLLSRTRDDQLLNLFVKPKSTAKLFTGFVLRSGADLASLHELSKETKLYCSSVVEWLSEYRVFVVESRIVGIKHYAGNLEVELDMEIVEKAIQDFEDSSQRTAAYGIDFGVLENGKTALVGWNDGFALGAYSLEDAIYTELIIARWKELVNSTKFKKILSLSK